MAKLNHYGWLRYGPVAYEDIRIMKLRRLCPEAYICYWDLLLIVKNSGGELSIETKNFEDFEMIFHAKNSDKSFLDLYESLSLIEVDRKNFKVTLPEKFLNLVGSNSTERVRASRKRKQGANDGNHEEDCNLYEENEVLHETNDVLHETNDVLHGKAQMFQDDKRNIHETDEVLLETVHLIDQNRSEQINKDKGYKQIWQD